MTSLIITAFNYDKYLERCIRSALQQDLPASQFEIIVVDDCSTDRTQDILSNYEDAVRVYTLPANMGLSAARNFGIKKARGEYVIFLDADDYIHSELLRLTKIFLDQNKTLDAISVDYWVVSAIGERIRVESAISSPIACGILFRKDYLFEIGLYDEDFVSREEEDLRIRWEKRFSIYNLPIPLYRYRNHESNMTKDVAIMNRGQRQLGEKHGEGEP